MRCMERRSMMDEFNLDDTLEELEIDDDPPLTQREKQATLRMLLQSRSGVYHSYVGGTPDMRERMPAREAHPPGAFWYYNNWDFNVLGGVYERKLGRKIGEAFRAEIATPIQMQDFRSDDMYYVKSADNARSIRKIDVSSLSFSPHGARYGEIWISFLTGRELERNADHPGRLGQAEHDLIFGNRGIW